MDAFSKLVKAGKADEAKTGEQCHDLVKSMFASVSDVMAEHVALMTIADQRRPPVREEAMEAGPDKPLQKARKPVCKPPERTNRLAGYREVD